MVAGTAPKIQEMIYALNNINASTDKEYAIAEAAVYNQYMDSEHAIHLETGFRSPQSRHSLIWNMNIVMETLTMNIMKWSRSLYLHPIIRDTVSKSISMKPISVMYFKAPLFI